MTVLLLRNPEGAYQRIREISSVEWVEGSGLGVRDTFNAKIEGRTDFRYNSLVILEPYGSSYRIFGPYDVERANVVGEQRELQVIGSANYYWEERFAAQAQTVEENILASLLTQVRSYTNAFPFNLWLEDAESDMRLGNYPTDQLALSTMSADMQKSQEFNAIIAAAEKWGFTAYHDVVPRIEGDGTISRSITVTIRPKYPVSLDGRYASKTAEFDLSNGIITSISTGFVDAAVELDGVIEAGSKSEIPDDANQAGSWETRQITSAQRLFAYAEEVTTLTIGTVGPTVYIDLKAGNLARLDADLERWRLQNEAERLTVNRYGGVNIIAPHSIVTHQGKQWRIISVKHVNMAGLYYQTLEMALWQGIPVVSLR